MNAGETGEFIAALFILVGSIISVISAFGMIRFPDVYSRAHAGTKSSTLGVLLTLVGAFIYFWVMESLFSIRLILGIIFVFITSPTSGHLVIRAAYRSGVPMTEKTVVDELKDVFVDERKEKKGE
ncbi:MAG TPA: Na+/H+ antiporter subunit G [Bacillota bacterium]